MPENPLYAPFRNLDGQNPLFCHECDAPIGDEDFWVLRQAGTVWCEACHEVAENQ